MDTITHGIAGALIAKAAFDGDDLFSPGAMSKRRIITWSLMLGAVFPDSDVIRDMFSSNELLMLTWHRSITHSLLCLPLWTVLLAACTVQVARWRKWEAPAFPAMCGIWALGILSHIFLDLVTTYGTMIWSPLQWSRPAWDILFIVDFTFTAIILIPQLLAWTSEHPEHLRRRAFTMCLIFIPAPFLIAKIAQIVGAPISDAAISVATLLFAALFLLPAFGGWGERIPYITWNRAGLALACSYLLAATFAHHVALQRIVEFANRENVQVENIGALPYPPSIWHWDGLIRGPRGVYELNMDLSEGFFDKGLYNASHSDPDVIQHKYYPDAFPNAFIDQA
ncbi:MAG TPA: metal-dependent hydrolase, partial [Candidatus Acidoferrum sp.]